MYIDTHCHLTYDPLAKDLDSVLQRALEAGIVQLITVATDLTTARKCITLAERYPAVFATVGIHPSDLKSARPGWQKEIEDIAGHPKIIAIGEIGIDYYWNHSDANTQQRFFREQLELAKNLALPAIIHNRRADDDIKTALLASANSEGVLHCYSSTADFAEEMQALGLHISFTGNATYGSKKTENAIRATCLERLMLETDAPFLTPASQRGQSNEPANLPLIAAKIAEIKNLPIKTVAIKTTETARQFFQLPK
jgi:TatD DNase family protein